MTRNVGNIERTLRITFGITIMVVGVCRRKWWGVFGLMPLVTGISGICPAYSMLGISTCGDRLNFEEGSAD